MIRPTQALFTFQCTLLSTCVPQPVELIVFRVANDAVYSYVEDLESRLERMERLVNKVS